MTRQLPAVLLFVMLAASLSGLTSAQGQPQTPPQTPPQGQPPGPGGGGGRGGVPAQTDLGTAQKMVAAAEAAAVAANARVAIAVVDANGDLVYFRRMDGASGQAVTSSQAKARGAILFGMATKEVSDLVAAGKPVAATVTPSGAGAFQVSVQQGGIPVVKNGKVVAGIGVGGSAPAQDEVFAKAGADAVK